MRSMHGSRPAGSGDARGRLRSADGRVDLEDGCGQMKARDNRVEQTAFLPAGMIGGPQADQDVVWRELADRIAERGQGIVSPHSPGCLIDSSWPSTAPSRRSATPRAE